MVLPTQTAICFTATPQPVIGTNKTQSKNT
jgi:hypothetical protein